MSCLLPAAALRQASCRNGSGGRGAETMYSNNGPRVIREASYLLTYSRGHRFGRHASRASPPLQTCARATRQRRRMRVRLPSSTIEDGLPSPSKSKPARASLLHRLLNKHIILLLMLALTVRRSSHTCKCAPRLTLPAFSARCRSVASASSCWSHTATSNTLPIGDERRVALSRRTRLGAWHRSEPRRQRPPCRPWRRAAPPPRQR